MSRHQRLLLAVMLSVLMAVSSGCDSKPSAKLQEDMRRLDATAQAMGDELQWKLDDATAVQIFDDGTEAGMNRYLTFRKCHEEPPSHNANKKACATLQARVAKYEATEAARQASEKASW